MHVAKSIRSWYVLRHKCEHVLVSPSERHKVAKREGASTMHTTALCEIVVVLELFRQLNQSDRRLVLFAAQRVLSSQPLQGQRVVVLESFDA